jgi:Matrixin
MAYRALCWSLGINGVMQLKRILPSLAVACCLCGGGSASATTFIAMSEEDLAEHSDAALIGLVTRIESVGDEETQGVHTLVSIAADQVLFGDVSQGEVVLREIGGRLGERIEWTYGSPQYRVGEEVLVFVDVAPDGSLRTTSMAMGKFSLHRDGAGTTVATRVLGEGAALFDPATGRFVADPAAEERQLAPLAERIRSLGRERRHRTLPHGQTRSKASEETSEETDSFTFLSSPSRWFEPDDGNSVVYGIDATGDEKVGPADSRAAIDDAFAAWSNVPSSSLTLADGGPIEPVQYAGCGGGNRIVFNDPFNEVSDPGYCGGVLAIGGFCVSSETRVVNATTFRRIVVGKIVFNNGWSDCPGWNRCNLSEVATHEIGHTVGFGHSADTAATMAAIAHFDGRCAGLRQDDIDAVTFAYPNVVGAELTSTPTPTPTPSFPFTPTRTPTRTFTPTRTPTHTFTPTYTPTRTFTPTRTPTRTFTPTTAATSTSTPTRTNTPVQPTSTSTRTPTRTRTRTPTSTPTFTWTPTSIPTDTPPSPTNTAGWTPTNTPTWTSSPKPSATAVPRYRVRGRVLYYSGAKPVPAAVLRLVGSGDRATETAADGAYSFSDVEPGAWELTPQKSSDAASAVSALDAAYVLQATVGRRSLSVLQRLACDVTGNGEISSLDAARILQYSVGVVGQLPVAAACDQDWAFLPAVTVATDSILAIPPGMEGGECQHGKIMLDDLEDEAAGLDFEAVLFGDCTGNWAPQAASAEASRPTPSAPRVRIGRLHHGRGDTAVVRLYVRSPQPFHSLNVTLSYDPDQLGLPRVTRRRPARDAILATNAATPGQLVLAMASADGFGSRSAALLDIAFSTSTSPKNVSPVAIAQAIVDEAPAVALSRSRRRR